MNDVSGNGGTGAIGRRHLLAGATAALMVTLRPAGAAPANRTETTESAIRRFAGDAVIRSGRVSLDLPPLVENGNTVAMAVTVDSPMTARDYVKAIHVVTEKNPQPNVISVKLGFVTPASFKSCFARSTLRFGIGALLP